MSAHPSRPPRAARASHLPLLLAYLLVLLGTPVGEAGFLWMHLEAAHSVPARAGARVEQPAGPRLREDGAVPAPAAGRDTLPARQQEHAVQHAHPAPHAHADPHGHAAAHEHGRAGSHVSANAPGRHERVARAASEPKGRSVAPVEPHEHGGRVHTHARHPVPDAELLAGSLSKFYLAPSTTPEPSWNADVRQARHLPPTPHQAAARIDTPPPRLPG